MRQKGQNKLFIHLFRFANAGVCKILVGNKCDMEESRKVSTEEGMEVAKHYEIPFLETSAKNCVNVESSFVTMAKEIKSNLKNKVNSGGDKKHVIGKGTSLVPETEGDANNNKKKSSCCNT